MPESYDLPLTTEGIRTFLSNLSVGEEWRTRNGKGKIKRFNISTWNLFEDGNRERSRWGNLEQMTEDLFYFEVNKCLPPQDMPRW